jgi:hypothetical protein
VGENEAVITVELARALAAAGVMWQPRAGDRFVIDREQLHGQVFWISDLTVELHHFNDESVLGFNGTTEWALDSVSLDRTLWLPREDQLRELVGDRLDAVRRTTEGWLVEFSADGTRRESRHADLECAYAFAVLALG